MGYKFVNRILSFSAEPRKESCAQTRHESWKDDWKRKTIGRHLLKSQPKRRLG
jgi:hypothetical protein